MRLWRTVLASCCAAVLLPVSAWADAPDDPLLAAKHFIAHVSLAMLDADRDLSQDARTNMDAALQDLDALDKNPAALAKIPPIRVAKLTYMVRHIGEKQHQQHAVLIPFNDDALAMDFALGANKNAPPFVYDDSNAVYMSLAINSASSRSTLKEARDALDTIKDTTLCGVFLNNILTTGIGRETPIGDNPLQSLYDALTVSDVMLKSKQYEFTELSLEHAQNALRQYIARVTGERRQETLAMQQQINTLSDNLHKDDPATFDSAIQTNEDFLQKVRGWMGKAK